MQRSGTFHFHWLAALLLVLLAGFSPVTAAAPNIIFILADDMGYGDLGVLNSDSQIPTPSLDRLAREGMNFHDAHSPSAVCTPTRYGLLTGRYCWRSSLKRGVLNGYGIPLIEKDRPTVASILQQAGYQTGIVGKWHLGLNFGKREDGTSLDFNKPVKDHPGTRGFDNSYIIPASLDFPPYVYIENGRVTNPVTVEQPAQKFPAFLRKGPRSEDLVMEDYRWLRISIFSEDDTFGKFTIFFGTDEIGPNQAWGATGGIQSLLRRNCYYYHLTIKKPGWNHFRIDLNRELSKNDAITWSDLQSLYLFTVPPSHPKRLTIDAIKLEVP